MGDGHLDGVFAEALDGRLGPGARQRFNEHLGNCVRCTEAFADHQAVRQALRALPTASMPIPVRLPEHALGGVGRGRWRGLFESRVRTLGLTVGGLAAAAVVALTLVAVGRGTSSPPSPAAGAEAVAGTPAQNGGVGAAPGLALPTSASGLTAPRSDLATGPPAGYGNRVTVSVPWLAGEELVVATAQQTYAPGERVTIYAGLVRTLPASAAGVSGGGGALPLDATPLVQLATGAAAIPAAGTGTASGSIPIVLQAVRLPSGLYIVTMPASLSQGEAVTLIATVVPLTTSSTAPVGAPPISARLALEVG